MAFRDRPAFRKLNDKSALSLEQSREILGKQEREEGKKALTPIFFGYHDFDRQKMAIIRNSHLKK